MSPTEPTRKRRAPKRPRKPKPKPVELNPWYDWPLLKPSSIPDTDLHIEYARENSEPNARRQAKILSTSSGNTLFVSGIYRSTFRLDQSLIAPIEAAKAIAIARKAKT